MSPRVFPPLLLAALALPAHAAPRVGEAEVRESSNGVPCFTISEKEERRGGAPEFHAILITDPSRGRAKMWSMAMPPTRSFTVFYNMCIPYAGRVQALPQTPAAKLEPGKVYEVNIDAQVPNGPRAYFARFCLAKQRDGSVIVHSIGEGAHEGLHRFGCLPAD